MHLFSSANPSSEKNSAQNPSLQTPKDRSDQKKHRLSAPTLNIKLPARVRIPRMAIPRHSKNLSSIVPQSPQPEPFDVNALFETQVENGLVTFAKGVRSIYSDLKSVPDDLQSDLQKLEKKWEDVKHAPNKTEALLEYRATLNQYVSQIDSKLTTASEKEILPADAPDPASDAIKNKIQELKNSVLSTISEAKINNWSQTQKFGEELKGIWDSLYQDSIELLAVWIAKPESENETYSEALSSWKTFEDSFRGGKNDLSEIRDNLEKFKDQFKDLFKDHPMETGLDALTQKLSSQYADNWFERQSVLQKAYEDTEVNLINTWNAIDQNVSMGPEVLTALGNLTGAIRPAEGTLDPDKVHEAATQLGNTVEHIQPAVTKRKHLRKVPVFTNENIQELKAAIEKLKDMNRLNALSIYKREFYQTPQESGPASSPDAPQEILLEKAYRTISENDTQSPGLINRFKDAVVSNNHEKFNSVHKRLADHKDTYTGALPGAIQKFTDQPSAAGEWLKERINIEDGSRPDAKKVDENLNAAYEELKSAWVELDKKIKANKKTVIKIHRNTRAQWDRITQRKGQHQGFFHWRQLYIDDFITALKKDRINSVGLNYEENIELNDAVDKVIHKAEAISNLYKESVYKAPEKHLGSSMDQLLDQLKNHNENPDSDLRTLIDKGTLAELSQFLLTEANETKPDSSTARMLHLENFIRMFDMDLVKINDKFGIDSPVGNTAGEVAKKAKNLFGLHLEAKFTGTYQLLTDKWVVFANDLKKQDPMGQLNHPIDSSWAEFQNNLHHNPDSEETWKSLSKVIAQLQHISGSLKAHSASHISVLGTAIFFANLWQKHSAPFLDWQSKVYVETPHKFEDFIDLLGHKYENIFDRLKRKFGIAGGEKTTTNLVAGAWVTHLALEIERQLKESTRKQPFAHLDNNALTEFISNVHLFVLFGTPEKGGLDYFENIADRISQIGGPLGNLILFAAAAAIKFNDSFVQPSKRRNLGRLLEIGGNAMIRNIDNENNSHPSNILGRPVAEESQVLGRMIQEENTLSRKDQILAANDVIRKSLLGIAFGGLTAGVLFGSGFPPAVSPSLIAANNISGLIIHAYAHYGAHQKAKSLKSYITYMESMILPLLENVKVGDVKLDQGIKRLMDEAKYAKDKTTGNNFRLFFLTAAMSGWATRGTTDALSATNKLSEAAQGVVAQTVGSLASISAILFAVSAVTNAILTHRHKVLPKQTAYEAKKDYELDKDPSKDPDKHDQNIRKFMKYRFLEINNDLKAISRHISKTGNKQQTTHRPNGSNNDNRKSRDKILADAKRNIKSSTRMVGREKINPTMHVGNIALHHRSGWTLENFRSSFKETYKEFVVVRAAAYHDTYNKLDLLISRLNNNSSQRVPGENPTETSIESPQDNPSGSSKTHMDPSDTAAIEKGPADIDQKITTQMDHLKERINILGTPPENENTESPDASGVKATMAFVDAAVPILEKAFLVIDKEMQNGKLKDHHHSKGELALAQAKVAFENHHIEAAIGLFGKALKHLKSTSLMPSKVKDNLKDLHRTLEQGLQRSTELQQHAADLWMMAQDDGPKEMFTSHLTNTIMANDPKALPAALLWKLERNEGAANTIVHLLRALGADERTINNLRVMPMGNLSIALMKRILDKPPILKGKTTEVPVSTPERQHQQIMRENVGDTIASRRQSMSERSLSGIAPRSSSPGIGHAYA